MKRAAAWVSVGLVAGIGLAAGWRGGAPAHAAGGGAEADLSRQVQELQTKMKELQGLVPDQAAVMTKVAYHFTNLWEAVEKENWALADFYLSEARNNVKWAVRTKPVRKDPQGRDIDLGAIAQAVDGSQFEAVKKAIAAKDKGGAEKAYADALEGCYACHKASGKPFLRPQRPGGAEVRIINMDPAANWPE